MLFYRRCLVYIKRNWSKSLLFVTLVFLLTTLMMSAIIVGKAVEQTKQQLLRQIPPLATLIQDGPAILEASEVQKDDFIRPVLTPELIETIGELPHVSALDYGLLSYDFFSYDVNLINDKTFYLEAGFFEEDIDSLFSNFAQNEGELDQFMLKGVRHPDVADVLGGAITLVTGRTFTEEEVLNGVPVALIPEEFAQGNGLDIGDVFELNASVYETMRGGPGRPEEFQQDDLLLSETVSFSVVGIFTPNVMLDEFDWLLANNYRDLNNQIYVPLDVAKLPDYLFLDYLLQDSEVSPSERLGFDVQPEDLMAPQFDYEHLVFILHDPLDIEAFNMAASELLPEFWLVNDLTDGLSELLPLLMYVGQIATWLIVGATGACLIILGLLLVLSFRDRRYEIGIYLALGEGKLKIMAQLILEVVILTHFALLFSFLAGYILADQVSTQMLQNHLLDQVPVIQDRAIGGLNDFNQMGLHFTMSIEELMESYGMVLNGGVLLTLYLSSIAVTILSTLIPLIYLLRLNPKKVLMVS